MESPLGQSIIMTGGAGYLGRAILDRAHREQWETRITVYSRDEEKQWRIKNRWPDTICILGDITDLGRVTAAISGHDTVLHLAAHKFVPEAERDVSVAVRANVEGTRVVADAADISGVKSAIFVSTDKASDPISLYGMTKAIGEKIWAEHFRTSRRTAFRVARYGNVIGSTGSVLPLFVDMLQNNRQITITDPSMTRFMMPIQFAIDTIIASWRSPWFMTVPFLAASGLLEIAKAAGIIARNDPDLAGEIRVIGPRPGEKTHETLVSERESGLVASVEPGSRFISLVPEMDRAALQYTGTINRPKLVSSAGAPLMTAQEIAEIFRQSEGI